MKYKLVKIYDIEVDEKKGVINSAKVKEICDLNEINKHSKQVKEIQCLSS